MYDSYKLMPNLSLKQKIMILLAIIGAVLIALFQHGLYSKSPLSFNTISPSPPIVSTPTLTPQPSLTEPQIIATDPPNLNDAIILPNQEIKLTFNLPLENVGEFKNRLEPFTDLQVKLSDDRKTAIISPKQTFKLGTSYTLFIKPDSKFDGHIILQHDIIFHFRTIDYKGV